MSRDPEDNSEPGFAELLGGKVRRLTVDTVEPDKRRPPPRRRAVSDEEAVLLDDYSEAAAGHAEPAAEFQRPGVQNSLFRKLRRGQFEVVDELDLHGLRIDQARSELAAFLESVRMERMCCVRIIHGKGLSSPDFKAVLKPRVRHWLGQDRRVLAYTPALANAGGDGATLVLLRSHSGKNA